MFENLTINVTALEEQAPFPDCRGLLPRLAAVARGLFSCWCLIVLGSAFSLAEASEPTVCAVIKAQASGEIATGAQELLEQSLLATPGMTLVERAIIDRVVGELALSASQENVDIGKRLQLGKLLKADLLVLLFESKRKQETVVAVRVVESSTGLQLAAETFLWDAKQPETTLTSLLGVVVAAEERRKAGTRAVVAVPPLECTDRGPAQAHWRKPLATIVQERLLTHKGVLVVELDEARAFTTEFFVGKETARLNHSLPFYLLGKYSTEVSGEDLSFSLDFTLSQNDKEILRKTISNVRQADMSKEVSRVADEVARQLADTGQDAAMADPITEAKLLTRRADLFRKLGEYDVALPLYETVVLLDPANLDARVYLLSVLHWLGDSRYLEYIKDPWIPKEEGELHLWLAERGIEHLEYVCQNAPLSDAVQATLRSFRQSLMVLGSWARGNPGDFESRFLRFCRRREAAYVQFISRLQEQGNFSPAAQDYLIKEFGFLVGDAAASDAEAGVASMRQLLLTVRERDRTVTFLVTAVANLGLDVDRFAPAAYDRLLDELLASARRDLRTAGKFGRVFSSINNPETKQKALAAMQALDEWQQLADWQKKRFEDSAEWCMESRGRRGGTLPPEKSKSVFIPRLEAVPVSLDGAGALANHRVHDWVNCAEQGDCIATDAGIFLANGGSGRNISRLVASRLCWDGRWIWATTEKAINAIEPQTGAIFTFGPDDVGYEVSASYLLCPIKPGTIAVVGHLFGLYRSTRTWISLLAIGDDRVSKKAQVIYDAREQNDETENYGDRLSPHEAFLPLWALILKKGPSDETPVLAIGRGENLRVQPLTINLADHSAAVVRTPWPGFRDGFHVYPCAIQHSNTLYLAMGKFAGAKQWAGVFATPDLDTIPEMFANFGVCLRSDGELYGLPYFGNAIVHDNVLHLLTNLYHNTPHWVAVDLQTRATHELVSALPSRFWGDHRLVLSSGNRLVFLAQGAAYTVTLPDRNTWPRFPEKPTRETTLRNWPPTESK